MKLSPPYRMFASCAVAFAALVGAATAAMSPEAAPVAHALRDAQGGDAWNKVHYLRFDWVVERDGQEVARMRHLWDRYTGNYRVEWKDKEGRAIVALFNVNTKAGRAWAAGTEVTGKDSEPLLARAYGRFINDSYWLLMPSKLEDPGVQVESAGSADVDGRKCDLLHVTFAKVGMTPGDQYWAYVDRDTHLMTRWAYFLEDDKGTPSLEAATAWQWGDWKHMGGVMMSSDRVQVGGEGKRRIYFPVLGVLDKVDDKVFTDPAVLLPDAPTIASR